MLDMDCLQAHCPAEGWPLLEEPVDLPVRLFNRLLSTADFGDPESNMMAGSRQSHATCPVDCRQLYDVLALSLQMIKLLPD